MASGSGSDAGFSSGFGELQEPDDGDEYMREEPLAFDGHAVVAPAHHDGGSAADRRHYQQQQQHQQPASESIPAGIFDRARSREHGFVHDAGVQQWSHDSAGTESTASEIAAPVWPARVPAFPQDSGHTDDHNRSRHFAEAERPAGWLSARQRMAELEDQTRRRPVHRDASTVEAVGFSASLILELSVRS